MKKLLNLFRPRRNRMEKDLDRELRYHIDRRADDLMRSGLSEPESRRQAAVEFGGVAQVREEVRETWFWRWAGDRIRDLRYAVRALLRSPGFTAVAVLSLALGIGANAAIFSLVDQVLLRLLPVKEPERLVLLDWIGTSLADGWGTENLMSYPLCMDLQEQRQFFDGVFCRHPTPVILSAGQRPQPVTAEIVSGSYFPVLGVLPAMGRLIGESDNLQPGAHPVVVLSYDYWQNNLGGDPDIVGHSVLVNNHPMTVIGVAAAGFRGIDLGEVPALWVPAMMKSQATPEWDHLFNRRARWVHVFARLNPGVNVQQAKAGLQPWFQQMLEADTHREGFPHVTEEQRREFLASTIDVMPAAQGRSNLRRNLAAPLTVLMAGTLLLLLLACMNVANLFLARGVARSREVTTRMALGASRGRMTSLLLIDGVLVALAGGALGVAIAPAVSQTLLSFLPQGVAGIDLSSRMDYRVFLFAFLVSLVTGGVCGLAPALQAGRIPLIASLKERSNLSAGGGVRFRKALVVAQIAFTLILLTGAGLYMQTLARLQAKGPGFPTKSLLAFQINANRSGYSGADADRLIHNLLRTLREAPGVEHAGVASMQLLTGGVWSNYMTIQADERIATDRVVSLNVVSPGFFSALGTRVIAGRDFDDRDTRDTTSETSSYRSAIVNESFARRYFGDRSPIGHRIGHGLRPDTVTDIEIVGVVKDFSYRNMREETEQAFFPFWEQVQGSGTFYLRVRGEPASAFAAVRSAVEQVAPTLPALSLRTIEEQIDRSLTTERMLATLSGGFGAVALVLAVVGLYGVMSFVVTHRTQEIGIRLALGATRSTALWLVIRDSLVMIGAGTAIALPCVWALSRVIESQLFGVHGFDALTIAAASGLLALVALGAAMLPAWRAASVSPTEALRYE